MSRVCGFGVRREIETYHKLTTNRDKVEKDAPKQNDRTHKFGRFLEDIVVVPECLFASCLTR